jgi:pimeloyl-ACP methyl ester carboxylesterase
MSMECQWNEKVRGRRAAVRQAVCKRPAMRCLASDLQAVLGLAGDQPAILLGHSIGGMITLTFCGLFPQELGTRVGGIALIQTTYTNPVRTTTFSGLLSALEHPLIIPLLHLTIWLAPKESLKYTNSRL